MIPLLQVCPPTASSAPAYTSEHDRLVTVLTHIATRYHLHTRVETHLRRRCGHNFPGTPRITPPLPSTHSQLRNDCPQAGFADMAVTRTPSSICDSPLPSFRTTRPSQQLPASLESAWRITQSFPPPYKRNRSFFGTEAHMPRLIQT